MSEPRQFHLGRVTLATGMTPEAQEVVPFAVRLAGRLGAELETVFVEDEALRQLVALPAVRRLRLPTGAAEQIPPEMVQAEFSLQARRIESLLRAAAERAGVRWSFHRLSAPPGDGASELLLVAAGEAELRPGGTFAALAERAERLLLLPPGRAGLLRPHVAAVAAAIHRQAQEEAARLAAAAAAVEAVEAAIGAAEAVETIRAALAELGIRTAVLPGPIEELLPDLAAARLPEAEALALCGVGTASWPEMAALLRRLLRPLLLVR